MHCVTHARLPKKRHRFIKSKHGEKRKRTPAPRDAPSFEQLLAEDVKKDEKSRKRHQNQHMHLVQPPNENDIVKRMKFGPKITQVLARSRKNASTRSFALAPSSSSTSSR